MDQRHDRELEQFNQPPPLEEWDPFASDPVLAARFARDDLRWAVPRLSALAGVLGRAETARLGEQANRRPPELRTHDRFGRRIDEVEFHPAWHDMLRIGVGHGVHNAPWVEPRAGSHAARAASLYLLAQVEAGVTCPLSMTYAAVPTLRHAPPLLECWLPLLSSTEYDARFLPPTEKRGALVGMAMTERQGGSDVRSNTTEARAAGNGEYTLHGHKWFCSAPMCDAFLTLARTAAGSGCFLVPRFVDDGSRNAIRIVRLKDKLGNRSNASSEIEYDGARARLVGEEGRGIATIIDMVQHTRLDCIAGSAAQMRQALFQAIHHATHRSVFGRTLIEQPLMRNVLADLAIEVEAATLALVRLARGFDDDADDRERAFVRLATPVLKYWVCKRAPVAVGEALECLGGNGYVEESILPRLYREAPLMSIWEGSGNVICLDVLRAIARHADCVPAFVDELRKAAGADREFDGFVDDLESRLAAGVDEADARRLTQDLALALQGSLLLREGHRTAADGFVATRLGRRWAGAYGSLPVGLETTALVERHAPRPS